MRWSRDLFILAIPAVICQSVKQNPGRNGTRGGSCPGKNDFGDQPSVEARSTRLVGI